MSRKCKSPDTRTWTVEEVATQERALELRVSNAAREFDEARKWHRAELMALRKFRKAKITNAAQIVSGPAAGSAEQPCHGPDDAFCMICNPPVSAHPSANRGGEA